MGRLKSMSDDTLTLSVFVLALLVLMVFMGKGMVDRSSQNEWINYDEFIETVRDNGGHARIKTADDVYEFEGTVVEAMQFIEENKALFKQPLSIK